MGGPQQLTAEPSKAECFVSQLLKALYGRRFVGPVPQDCPAYKIAHHLANKITQLQDGAYLSLK